MREVIKFRVWCPIAKMFSTEPWMSCDGMMLKWDHTGNQSSLSDIRFDGYVVQRYSGLKDINDKDIYEGDIIEMSYKPDEHGDAEKYREEVVFENGAFGDTYDYFCNYMFLPSFSMEVIGNVFENPELLNKYERD
jgi:uncharacterized phage protein (TIGR01671 family)